MRNVNSSATEIEIQAKPHLGVNVFTFYHGHCLNTAATVSFCQQHRSELKTMQNDKCISVAVVLDSYVEVVDDSSQMALTFSPLSTEVAIH